MSTVETVCLSARHTFSKVPSIEAFTGSFTRALTFQNFCQANRGKTRGASDAARCCPKECVL